MYIMCGQVQGRERAQRVWETDEREGEKVKVFTEQTRLKMSDAAKRRCTPEWRAKKSETMSTARVAAKRNQFGTNNSSWKGKSALYGSFHQRVKYARGKAKDYGCAICGTRDKNKSYDWANLTGDYNNVMDYSPMCRSCHRKYDKGLVVMPNAKRETANAL